MMRPHEFLNAVRERAVARLPEELRGWRARVQYAALQAHYGNPRLHYEVWLVRKTGRIEIGLHIEAERETSRAWAAFLAAHADDLRASIGPGVELEDWTASWSRLHETVPLGPLSEDLSDEVAARLAASWRRRSRCWPRPGPTRLGGGRRQERGGSGGGSGDEGAYPPGHHASARRSNSTTKAFLPAM
jgi:hypothetical protein